jgi:hypothetical protein
MRRGCDEHGADYRLVSTADDPEAVLSAFLVERMRR